MEDAELTAEMFNTYFTNVFKDAPNTPSPALSPIDKSKLQKFVQDRMPFPTQFHIPPIKENVVLKQLQTQLNPQDLTA